MPGLRLPALSEGERLDAGMPKGACRVPLDFPRFSGHVDVRLVGLVRGEVRLRLIHLSSAAGRWSWPGRA
jgi:hypothetical protein